MKNQTANARPAARNEGSESPSARERCAAAEQALANCQRTLMLGSISSTFAHDFNNLLGVISNSHHVLQRLCTDPAALASLEASNRAVTRGTRLTDSWHRLSTDRGSSGEAIDLRIFLQEMEELARTIVGKRVQLSLHVAPGIWRIGVDPNRLELSLIALLMNSRQAMPEGGQVWIDARNAEPAADLAPADHVALTVTDDGLGMNHSMTIRAFEPYFTTRAAQGASGVGLSQVKAFCVASGGTARLASTQGLGTAVTLLLPAEPSGVQKVAAGSSSTDAPTQTKPLNGTAKPLLG